MTTLLKRRILVHRLRAWLRLFFLGLLFLDALWPWLPFARQTGQPRTLVFDGFSMLGEVMKRPFSRPFRS